MREMFWQDFVRESLTALSVISTHKPELFDGRLWITTRREKRLALAEVRPLLACAIPGSSREREASVALECTIFRVRTIEGEVLTIPLHEVRAVGALTDELVAALEAAGRDNSASGAEPFGFRAFTSAVTRSAQSTTPSQTRNPPDADSNPSPASAPSPARPKRSRKPSAPARRQSPRRKRK